MDGLRLDVIEVRHILPHIPSGKIYEVLKNFEKDKYRREKTIEYFLDKTSTSEWTQVGRERGNWGVSPPGSKQGASTLPKNEHGRLQRKRQSTSAGEESAPKKTRPDGLNFLRSLVILNPRTGKMLNTEHFL